MKVWKIVLISAILGAVAFASFGNQEKVQTAGALYQGCFTARLTAVDWPTSRAPILNLVEEIDAWCYAWTVVWYGAQFKEELEVSPSVFDGFNRVRTQFRKIVKEELLKDALR